jgi:WD40 repeat protein
MRLLTAALVLRLPLKQGSGLCRQALDTVLREADSGAPLAMRAVAHALRSQDHEAVWGAWLRRSVSRPSPQRWASPLLAELLRGSTPVSVKVVNAAWGDWLDEHDATLWSLLERWDRPATASDPRRCSLSRLALGDDGVSLDPRLLVDTAARFDHPIGERARVRLLALDDTEVVDLLCAAAMDVPDLAEFCIAHHLAPADEVQRAMFFVRTGQHEQYQALDPDGELLALGYRSASSEERSALRTAMTALGGIDALRVLAGQRSQQDDLTALTEQERTYLVRRFADQGDWDRLWPLTVLMPLAEAVAAVRVFGDWRPPGEDDRRVFEALRAADLHTVRDRVSALSAASPSVPSPLIRIRLGDFDKRMAAVDDLDFAPDGTQLAFAGKLDQMKVRPSAAGGVMFTHTPVACAGIVDLGSRALSRLYSDFTYPVDRVAHLGAETIVVGEADSEADSEENPREKRIHYADRSGVRALRFETLWILGLERIAGDRAFIVSADGSEKCTVFVGNFRGSLVDSGILDDLDDVIPWVTVVDPDGRLIAVLDETDGVVADLAGSVVNKVDSGPQTVEHGKPLAALSPSTLVVRGNSSGNLRVWHEPFTSVEPSATIRTWSPETSPIGLAWSSALNRFLAVGRSHLELLDVPPTRDGPMPDDLVSERIALAARRDEPRCVRLSPKGDVLAVGGMDDTIDLYALTALTLRPVIAEPMGLMNHKDLADAVAALENPVLDGESRETLTLLRTCLEFRFRHDVGIGDTAAAVAHDDIALGG